MTRAWLRDLAERQALPEPVRLHGDRHGLRGRRGSSGDDHGRSLGDVRGLERAQHGAQRFHRSRAPVPADRRAPVARRCGRNAGDPLRPGVLRPARRSPTPSACATPGTCSAITSRSSPESGRSWRPEACSSSPATDASSLSMLDALARARAGVRGRHSAHHPAGLRAPAGRTLVLDDPTLGGVGGPLGRRTATRLPARVPGPREYPRASHPTDGHAARRPRGRRPASLAR